MTGKGWCISPMLTRIEAILLHMFTHLVGLHFFFFRFSAQLVGPPVVVAPCVPYI